MSLWCKFGLHKMGDFLYEGYIIVTTKGMRRTSNNSWKRDTIHTKRDMFSSRCQGVGCGKVEYNFKNR